MNNTDELSFKEMCARFDVTPRTLRYYEYIELLSPRKVGRSRFYGPREIARMTLVLRGRRFGFALEQIRQWLDLYESRGSHEQYSVWIELATAQLAVLDHQITELSAARTELAVLRDESEQLLQVMRKKQDQGQPQD